MSASLRLRWAGLVAALAGLVLAGTAGTPATGLPAWQDTNSSWSHPAAVHPKVVGLRYAAHPTYDRVVIDIAGRIPSGSLTYRRHFVYDGSGDKVPILGRSGLQLALTPAAAHDDAGTNLYTGPTLARPRLRTLKALALTGDFEGQVIFSFALTHRAPYRVFELSSPHRLVIDFQHG